MVTELLKEPPSGLLAQAQHYWHVLLKWKWTAAYSFVAVAPQRPTAFLSRRLYGARKSLDRGRFEHPSFRGRPIVRRRDNLQSHARLLQSRTLAADIIDKMKLYENPILRESRKRARIPLIRQIRYSGKSSSRNFSRISEVSPATAPSSSMSASAAATPSWRRIS